MTIEIKVPVLPESVSDATIATWHKKPGDAGRDFDLVFLGKDGKAGGEGQDKDYGSWEK